MKRNIKLDATLVHASMNGLFEPCAIGLGMTPDEAFARASWLKKQPESYIDLVVQEVACIEKEASTDGTS